MEDSSFYFGIVCLIIAMYVLTKGILAAIRLSQDPGAGTIIPPPVMGAVASVLLTYGLGLLKFQLLVESYTGEPIPWWGYRAIFPGTTMLFPAIIYIIGRRPPSK
ncbi:MAG: hypothetical protein OEY28_10380 [Nitrospira sp.]|nr:hypothetical protein [Nitrospira sp.]